MSHELTKDAEALLAFAYKLYFERRESGLSKAAAADFTSEDFSVRSSDRDKFSDYTDTLRELSDSFIEYMDCEGNFQLTAEAIVRGERKFPNKVADVLDWMARIKDAVPLL